MLPHMCRHRAHNQHPCLQCLVERAMPRRSVVYALTPPPSASIAAPTTQPTPPHVRSVWGRLRNSVPMQTSWFEALLPVKLCCPARQYARGSFPETLDLKSAWYDATATEMLVESVRRTLTAYPPSFTPQGQRHPPPLTHPHSLFTRVRRRLSLPSRCTFYFVFLGSFVWFPLRCGFFGLVWLCLVEVFGRHNFWLHTPVCTQSKSKMR